MEPYAPTGGGDPFAASMKLVTALVADLQAGEAAGLTAHELEQFVAGRGREVLRQMVQDHLDLRAAREEQAARERSRAVAGADGVTRSRVETGHRRLLATLFGTVQVSRCAWRRPGAGNLYPADADLSLPAPRHSHTLARLAVLEAARGSFEAAHAAITSRCGPVIGKRQVEQAVVNAAGDIAAFYAAARIPVPCTARTLLVISADAKGIVMRPGALRPATARAATRQGKMRTRLAAGEKPNRKRMATLACVYDAEPAPRRPHDVIAPPGGRHGNRTPRPRPKARAKWLAGSVEHDPAEVIAAAFDQAEARDPARRRTWVVLVDGAEHQLGLIRAEAARRGITISILIDLIHVLEYIWKAAWSLHAADPAAEDWVAVKALAVLAGDSARAAAEITAEADAAGLTASQRNGADTCVRYLTGKHEFLRYDQALAAGWPIATGVIEGACRHLIGDRLDITGARWGLDGAEAILTLRAVISNGDFDEYWRFHLAREHQRLYPGTAQREYTLGA
jgi:hypothetical protein